MISHEVVEGYQCESTELCCFGQNKFYKAAPVCKKCWTVVWEIGKKTGGT